MKKMGGTKLLPSILNIYLIMNRIVKKCLVFMFSISGLAQNGFVSKTVEISKNSELSISGDTNINTFGCEFNTFYLEPCREVIYKKSGNNILFKNAILSLRNEGFDCGHKAINKDFHALLQTEDHPSITLELTEISLLPNNNGRACVKITIAGKENTYYVPVHVITGTTNRFAGWLQLNIRNFGLEPPKKLFGMIVIKEEIDINFDILAVF